MPLRVTNERFDFFYDRECSLCSKEIALLRRLDRHHRIEFTDIADPSFDAQAHTGLSYESLIASIYGKMPDGSLVNGVEVFRQLYGRVGFRRVAATPSSQSPSKLISGAE